MGKPVVTMSAVVPTRRARCDGLSQRDPGARGHRANAFLDQSPRGFNRVRNRASTCGRNRSVAPTPSNQVAAPPGPYARANCPSTIDVVAAQVPHQVAADPRDESRFVQRTPRRGQRQPAVDANRADQCQVGAPVHRPRFHQNGPARQPRVRAPHGQIRARFVEKHQPARVYPNWTQR